MTNDTNFLSLTLNNEKTNVNLEIDDGRTDKFIVKTENGELNIYENVLSGRGKERFKKIQGLLNKYLHPYFQHMDIGEEECSKCPATTRYDENRYYEWLDFFQNITDFIIEMLLCYYPTVAGTTDVKEALGHLKNLEALKIDLGIPMIKSKYLKDRITRLPDIEDLIEVER